MVRCKESFSLELTLIGKLIWCTLRWHRFRIWPKSILISMRFSTNHPFCLKGVFEWSDTSPVKTNSEMRSWFKSRSPQITFHAYKGRIPGRFKYWSKINALYLPRISGNAVVDSIASQPVVSVWNRKVKARQKGNSFIGTIVFSRLEKLRYFSRLINN